VDISTKKRRKEIKVSNICDTYAIRAMFFRGYIHAIPRKTVDIATQNCGYIHEKTLQRKKVNNIRDANAILATFFHGYIHAIPQKTVDIATKNSGYIHEKCHKEKKLAISVTQMLNLRQMFVAISTQNCRYLRRIFIDISMISGGFKNIYIYNTYVDATTIFFEFIGLV